MYVCVLAKFAYTLECKCIYIMCVCVFNLISDINMHIDRGCNSDTWSPTLKLL